MSLNEQWFTLVQGSTDSEWAFALFLDSLDKAGVSPDSEPGKGGFGHSVLRKAILKTIERINGFIRDVVGEENMGNEDSRSLLNFAVTDGESVVCTRYVSSTTDEAASLFFSSGTSWKQLKGEHSSDSGKSEEEDRNYVMERRDKGSDIVLVASEPLTFERGISHATLLKRLSTDICLDNWVTVPTNSTLTISKQTVMIHPIIDSFYSPNPAHERPAGFAQAKGQTVTGPDKRVLTDTKTPGSDAGSPLRSANADDLVSGAIRRLRVE